MPVAYRSVFTLLGNQKSTEDIVLEQFNEWLMKDPARNPRKLNRDLYKINAITIFNSNTELIFFDHKTNDGSRTMRARLIENKNDDGRWVSTLTLHFPQKRPNETIVMYEGDAPFEIDIFGNRKPRWVGRPGLVRRILEVTTAYDVVRPEIEINLKPRIIDSREDCEALFDALCDPERTICIAVVASKKDENPINKVKFIESLLHETMGTAASYILTNRATHMLNQLVGDPHSIYYDNLRIFVPDFDPAVELNSRIHPIVKMVTVNKGNMQQVTNYLGGLTRRYQLDKPLMVIKRELARVSESLNDREYEVLLSGKKIIEVPKIVTSATIVDEKLPIQVTEYLRIYDKIRSSLGVEEFSDEIIDEISEKITMHDLLTERLVASTQTIRDIEVEAFVLKEERDDAILLSTEATIVANSLRDRVRWLQNELSLSNRAINAWAETPESEIQFIPNNFSELFENLYRLPNLVFTGDRELTIKLDQTELGARSGNAWNELCGLNDYCEAKRAGLVNGGLKQYLDSLPNGFRPMNNYRAKESESVENNSALRNQRLFRVPIEVDSTGKTYMFSHSTIGKRLHIHFLDDFSNSGKIYIGRIGNHLDTASTN
jgi:hypothetical protein